MKIWKLVDPRSCQYAWFSSTNCGVEKQCTWKNDGISWNSIADRYGLCRDCMALPPFDVTPGLTIEWMPGADVIGDFSWDESGTWPILQEQVLNELAARFRGFAAAPVEMTESPKVRRPQRITKRTKPRVWLPYTGPTLHQLWITKIVPIDLEKSTVRLVRQCATCGRERYELCGAEHKEPYWDREQRVYVRLRKPRDPGEGLFVREIDLERVDMFRVKEFDGWKCCTDRAKDFIEEHGYTNVDFMELGETD